MYTTLWSPPPTETWPTTNGWAYTWSSTGSVNTAPNCCRLTLVVVNAVSLSFQPDRLLSLCCVSTDADCGFGTGFVPLAGAELSLQVVSNRKKNDRGSLCSAMSDPQKVYCGTRMPTFSFCVPCSSFGSSGGTPPTPACWRESQGFPQAAAYGS